MALSGNIIGVKGDECQCGRRATIRHCPSCGSVRSYARQNRKHKYLDGSERFVDVEFRCQSCGHLYIEEEREFCEAPPVGQKLAARKVQALAEAKASGEYMTPAQEKAAKAILAMTDAPKKEYTKNDLEILLYQATNLWIDDNNKARVAGKDFPTLIEFVKDILKQQGYDEVVVTRVVAIYEEKQAKLKEFETTQ